MTFPATSRANSLASPVGTPSLRTTPFAPRVSIVTGGANGIGRALAEQVVRRGGHVVIADLDGTAATATATSLTSAAALTSASAADGGSAEAVQVDVAEPGAVADLVERVSREHGRLDFMANNAGILVAGPLTEFTERQWEVAIDVNFRAVVAGGARHTP